MSKLHKGQFVTYEVGHGKVQARVLVRHKDGSVTAEARHYLDKNGQPFGGFIGGRVCLMESELTPVDPPPLPKPGQKLHLVEGDDVFFDSGGHWFVGVYETEAEARDAATRDEAAYREKNNSNPNHLTYEFTEIEVGKDCGYAAPADVAPPNERMK